MVKVREDHPISEDGGVDIQQWIERLNKMVPLNDVDQVRRACEMSREAEEKAIAAEHIWSPNTSSFRSGLEMAEILAELRLDQDTLVAAIMYRAVREDQLTLDDIRNAFGETVAKLVKGVVRMAIISSLQFKDRRAVLGQTQRQVEKFRKMLIAIVDDVRVALIKLAERTCAIRAVKNAPDEKKLRVAREVFDVYAPLAHRLGIGHIKWELEDLSFRYLEPDDYKKIAKLLDGRRVDRDNYIGKVLAALQGALKKDNINADISGRAKHIYSIWRKMRRKNIPFDKVYDVRAFRLLVDDLKDCYAALGIVHSLWRHIPHEFDDYITNPKENGYRSLHTAVIGPDAKVIEIQIRTEDMHEEAELGVCAHWRYKEGKADSDVRSYEEKIAWLRQVLEWQEELGNDLEGFADELRSDVVQDKIYVLTPDGHVVDMTDGATPLDFAYHIHTEVGHRCRGAKVNGRIVPLTYKLQTGDQVEILTRQNSSPSRDWLMVDLGYVQSSRARAKIAHWFKQQNREQNISGGKSLVEREFKRLGIPRVEYDELAEQLNFKQAEDMLAAVGAGDLKTAPVVNAAQRVLDKDDRVDQLTLSLSKSDDKAREGDISIRGVGNLLTQIAGCCQPVPGDAIIGYITQGRGVTIHREDCATALQLQEMEAERFIEVAWGKQPASVYPVDILVSAFDRQGLLRDITFVLANQRVNVIGMNTNSDLQNNMAKLVFTLETDSLETLGGVLAKINQLPNVIEARRYYPGG